MTRDEALARVVEQARRVVGRLQYAGRCAFAPAPPLSDLESLAKALRKLDEVEA